MKSKKNSSSFSSSRQNGRSSFSTQKVNPYSARDLSIELTNQDSGWAMMTSASNSVVSIYEEDTVGALRLDRIYDRVSEIVRLNPWLACRLRMTTGGIKAVYGNEFEDRFEAVSTTQKVDFTSMSYSEVVKTFVKYTVKSGECCIDQDEPLFRVTAISGLSYDGPLKQMCLVMSISAVIADAATMYSLFSMLDADTRPFKMEIARHEDYLKTVKVVLGSAQLRWLKSTGMFLGEWFKSWGANQHETAVYTVRKEWIEKKKAEYKGDDGSFVSTDDILTSWFMKMTKCDFGFINIDFRPLLDLHLLQENSLLAGRYVHHVLLRKRNFDTPLAVRNTKPKIDNPKKCHSDTPNFKTTVQMNSCLISNYATLTPKMEVSGCSLKLHIPILIRDKDRNLEQYNRWKSVSVKVVLHFALSTLIKKIYSQDITKMKWSFSNQHIHLLVSYFLDEGLS